MTSPARRLRVDQRRARLLALGLDLFASRSYEDVAIDEIAAAAGVSKGLLYHYYAGKREFYVAVVAQAFEGMREASEPDPTLPPVEQLADSLDGFLRFVEQHASGWVWLLRGAAGTDAELIAVGERVRGTVVDRVLRIAAPPGPAQPAPALLAALRGWVGFIGEAALTWLESGGLTRAQMVKLLGESLRGTLQAVALVDPVALRPDVLEVLRA